MTNKEAIEELKGFQEFINGTRLKGEIRAEAFDLAIKALENQPQWILVTERLPEKLVDVIVTDIETNETYSSYYLGNGMWECDNGKFNNRIIAWMPFPKPYTKEEQS